MTSTPSSPRSRGAGLALRLFMLALLPASALADSGPGVSVRVGNHDGYGRLVFDLPSRTDYHVTQQAQHVVIQFAGDVKLGTANATPRNVVGISVNAGQAELDVAPGAVVRDWRLGNRVVIDVLDHDISEAGSAAPPQSVVAKPTQPAAPPSGAAPATAPTAASGPSTAPPAAKPPVATSSPPAKPAPVAPSPPSAKPAPVAPSPQSETRSEASNPQPEPNRAAAPAPAPPPAPPPGSSPASPPEPAASSTPDPVPAPAAPALAAKQTRTDTETADLAIPADQQLGIAAFRRGNEALIVLDQPRPIDMTALRDDPIFGSATVQSLPTATVIRVPLDRALALSAWRMGDEWHIGASQQDRTLRPIQPTVTDDRLILPAAMPGAVVGVVDPDTGATLLVGTQRREGEGVPARRRSPEFALLPSWQGVAVEPHSDTVALRPTQQGFIVDGVHNLSPASEIADQLGHSAGLTRQFDFPNQPLPTRLERLKQQMAEDAAAPALARGPRRVSLARSMIAIGLASEAGSLLRMAATDDPHTAASPETAALTAIAALLAQRPHEADGLSDPGLPTADDIVFWRAVRLAQLHEGSPEAAAMLAGTLPLLLGYPPEMRDRLFPLVAETLVAGGETAAAASLLAAHKEDADLDLARAMVQEAQGDHAAALASYDRLARAHDQLTHARAAVRAVELRLSTGAIDQKQAAEQLERLLYAWRGDARERALRERVAELQAHTGAWRSALELLRDTEALFPDDKAAIHAKLADTFASLLRGDTADSLPPLEFVSVVEENADLLPTGADGEALQARLADRLLALDLPKRAGPVLEKLMQASGSSVTKAGFGARLAALRLREDDAGGALAVLDGSAAADLPADLTERRSLLAADADARRGNIDRALATLGGLDSAAADEAKATILERANNWPAAQKALTSLAARTVPSEGKLDDTQRRTLLRLATAAARAGDDAALAALRQREAPRMETGALADMFRLLTADQVHSVADLKRSGQEATLAHALPQDLNALQATAKQTR